MITVNVWCAGGMGGGEFANMEINGGDEIFAQTYFDRFLKTLTEGAVTTEAGSLFQYFTTLTENGDPSLRRWIAL